MQPGPGSRVPKTVEMKLADVSDPLLEHGAGSEILIEMDRIGVTGNSGKEDDVRLRYGLGVDRRHACFQVLDIVAV